MWIYKYRVYTHLHVYICIYNIHIKFESPLTAVTLQYKSVSMVYT